MHARYQRATDYLSDLTADPTTTQENKQAYTTKDGTLLDEGVAGDPASKSGIRVVDLRDREKNNWDSDMPHVPYENMINVVVADHCHGRER